MLACQICGKLFKGLTLHLLLTHKVKPSEYSILYPGAKIFSEEVLEGENFGGRHMKGKKRKPVTAETKLKMSIARKNRPKGYKHSKETIEKMKATSQKPEVMKSRRDGTLKHYAEHPEAKEKQSIMAKLKIAKDGLHLKRGKITKLEQTVIDALNRLGLEFKREVRSGEIILNAYRFFDFYVPALNLIIEADGEFWHKQELRVEIDRLKTLDALASGFKFLRISDKDKLEDSMISDSTNWEANTKAVIERRRLYISLNGYTPAKALIPMDPEERNKILSQKSKNAWVKKIANGWEMSPEHRDNISKSRKGRVFGPRDKPYNISAEVIESRKKKAELKVFIKAQKALQD
jgi:very-short-patch-repair endonuclease